MELTRAQRVQINNKARHLAGKVSALVSVQTNGIGIDKIRELLNGIYNCTDELVELVDGFEKE